MNVFEQENVQWLLSRGVRCLLPLGFGLLLSRRCCLCRDRLPFLSWSGRRCRGSFSLFLMALVLALVVDQGFPRDSSCRILPFDSCCGSLGVEVSDPVLDVSHYIATDVGLDAADELFALQDLVMEQAYVLVELLQLVKVLALLLVAQQHGLVHGVAVGLLGTSAFRLLVPDGVHVDGSFLLLE